MGGKLFQNYFKSKVGILCFLKHLTVACMFSSNLTCNYKFIRPTGSQRPRMYALTKTHKKDVPLRPILSMTGSAQHQLAKCITCKMDNPTSLLSLALYSNFFLRTAYLTLSPSLKLSEIFNFLLHHRFSVSLIFPAFSTNSRNYRNLCQCSL